MVPQHNSRLSLGKVRIIAGQWRGRSLVFPEAPGLRPSPDRVRETLFNWLMPVISEARCLDLFAGSGAFGFEALSRGAAETVFVDNASENLAAIASNANKLGVVVKTVQEDVLHFLAHDPNPGYDVLFLDPPFRRAMVGPCLALIMRRGYCRPGAYCYVETEIDCPEFFVPEGWDLHRELKAGQVWGRLYRSTE